MAIGAYTTAIVRIPPDTKQALFPKLPAIQLSSFEATLVGATAAALAAFLVAIPLMRLSGLAASLGTFAFLNIVYVVASNWSSVSGGSTGLANVPQTTTRFTGVLSGRGRDLPRMVCAADASVPATAGLTRGRGRCRLRRHWHLSRADPRLRAQRVHHRDRRIAVRQYTARSTPTRSSSRSRS